ncbi:ATP-binding cassette glutathione S-conjugate transporter ycf1 [Coemansia sp. RSA 988]|nr:ATP-binding cassette glutathione S-conjugate transporter ycf1 [Coemansia sp. RSA 988]
MHWLSSLLHVILFLTNLDPQSQCMQDTLVNKVLFMQKRQLIRLGKLCDLVLEDMWQLPVRLRLEVIHSEFKYNVNEPLFLIRAILRMIWRPLLPIYALVALLSIADILEVMISSYVLHCLDAPLDHLWFQGYCAAFCLLLLKMSGNQRTRVGDYAEMEISRATRALKLAIFRLPLIRKGQLISEESEDVGFQVQALMNALQYVLSTCTSAFALVAAFWPVFHRVGWLVTIPPAISTAIMLTSWALEWLAGSRYERESSRNGHASSSRADEIYRGIKSIKLFGWECMYLDPGLQEHDAEEKRQPWYANVISLIWIGVDILEMLANELAFYLIVQIHTQNSTPVSVALTNSDLFQLGWHISNARSALATFCSQLQDLRSMIDNNISIERYFKHQKSSTLPRLENSTLPLGPVITMSACTFTWYKKAPQPVLEGISLNALAGELVAVVGKTGSGKSSLLLAICGELEMIEGTGSVAGTIGYLEQSPWIMNDTLRANIIFGREYDGQYLDKVIHACALAEDIAQWPDGDLTVIGDRGVNISGGQRARLALARCLYSRADIYVLDDPLSAVDVHVKRHILDHVILDTGLLAGKLRIVATHSPHILPFARRVVSLDNHTATVTLQIPRIYGHAIPPTLSPCKSAASDDNFSSLTAVGFNDESTFKTTDSINADDSDIKQTNSKAQTCTLWDNLEYVLHICGLPVLAIVTLSGLVDPITRFIMDGLELNMVRGSSTSNSFNRETTLSHLRLIMFRDALVQLIAYAETSVRDFIASKYLKHNAERFITRGRIADIIADGRRMIRLFGVESHFTNLRIKDGDEEYRLVQPIEALEILSIAVSDAIKHVGEMAITCLMLLQSRYTRFKVSLGECIIYRRLLNSLVIETSQAVHLSSNVCSFADDIGAYRQFASIEPEAPYIVADSRPALDWPQYGRIEFRNFNMRYREDLPPVLKDINLIINPGEKIGTVGRTGAGKSTLVKVLFRPPHTGTSGTILINDLDIASIGVGDLRMLIREEFSDCTVLTIAHRLETVINSDRIVVMDKCRIAEFGPPQKLLKNGGHFAALVHASNFGI